MKILVIGNGGREDALCKKISESEKVSKLYCAPGNAGTLRYAENVDITGNEELLAFAKEKNIDLVLVGPEAPLCSGIVDLFFKNGIRVFGANKKSAALEGSKNFAKIFMEKYGVPTARYKTVSTKADGCAALPEFSYPVVIKADGLCGGKGVKICKDESEARAYLVQLFDDEIFAGEGRTAVIEEFLHGEEASLICFVSQDAIIPMQSARDYKRIFDNDEGENTGGVGCYSPSELFDQVLNKKIADILAKISHGLKSEQLEYAGMLFIGFMIDKGEPKVLEFNVRFGDPETEVLLPRLESDLVLLIEKALDGTLQCADLQWSDEKCLTVILTSKGYPHKYETGKAISGIETLPPEIYVYHNNTKESDGKVLTNGGRVLSVTAKGSSFEVIRKTIYANIEKITFGGMQFRTDIGLM